jgi:hypothetical protein
LQRAQNAAACLTVDLRSRDHITSALEQLYCWPVEFWITYKLRYLMRLVQSRRAPPYLSDRVTTVAAASHRQSIRYVNTLAYIKPRTSTKFGKRSFFFSGPAAWITLPEYLQRTTDTRQFTKYLKTFFILSRFLAVYFCSAPGRVRMQRYTSVRKFTCKRNCTVSKTSSAVSCANPRHGRLAITWQCSH